MRRLTTLFPSEFLEEHAEELGVVERDRKLQLPAFVWAFVFGFAVGESRTLAGFRRSYNSPADETISPGGFYQRLTPSLAEYLCDLIETALDEVAVPDAGDVDIDRFRDVMIADGTVLRLHKFLSEEYKARHEEQAGAKLTILAILIVLFVFADHLKHVEIVPTTWCLVIALLGGFATLHNILFLL